MAAAAEGVSAEPAPRTRTGSFLQSEEAKGYTLISAPFLYALAMLGLPVVVVIAHSFWTQTYLTVDRTFTLENYRQAIFEPIYQDLLFRSLWISLVVSVLTVALAYPVAYFISFHGGRHKNIWLFVITVPFWTSYLLRVMAWMVVLG